LKIQCKILLFASVLFLSVISVASATHDEKRWVGPVEAGLKCNAPYTPSVKGKWGHVTTIKVHPNIFYNMEEIKELRRLVFTEKVPELVRAWDFVKGYKAKVITVDKSQVPSSHPEQYQFFEPYHYQNMAASFSYMIEPSVDKARVLKDSIRSFMRVRPGGLSGGVEQAYIGWSLPFMFDLLLGFNPELFSDLELKEFKEWYLSNSHRITGGRWGELVRNNPPERADTVLQAEGKTINGYPNWYSFHGATGLLNALVAEGVSITSKSPTNPNPVKRDAQWYVEYHSNSGWPEELYTKEYWLCADGRGNLEDTQNRQDLVTYIMAMFPSGAHWDTYHRGTFDPHGDGKFKSNFGYNSYQMWPIARWAEAAYHNGMKRVFEIKDSKSPRPSLLQWAYFTNKYIRTAKDADGKPLHHNFMGTVPYFLSRHYPNDPAVKDLIALKEGEGANLSSRPWEPFFAYPKDTFTDTTEDIPPPTAKIPKAPSNLKRSK
jgi:hypothetical protein